MAPFDGLDVLVWGLRLVAEDLRFEFLSIDNLISDILLLVLLGCTRVIRFCDIFN